jgi:hypothetical protein
MLTENILPYHFEIVHLHILYFVGAAYISSVDVKFLGMVKKRIDEDTLYSRS